MGDTGPPGFRSSLGRRVASAARSARQKLPFRSDLGPRSPEDYALLRRASERLSAGDAKGALRDVDAVLALRPGDAGARALRSEALGTPAVRGRSSEPSDLLDDARAAIRHLGARGYAQPVLLPYLPSKIINPFLVLLYSRALALGVAPLPLGRARDAEVLLPLIGPRARVALHLHWLQWVLRDADSAAQADERITDLIGWLDAFRSAGGSLVWTVHNVLPHDATLLDQESRLAQGIADRASMVHILAAETPDAVARHFTLPTERTVYVPHPSYAGAYPDHVDPFAARFALGLGADDLVYVTLGALKPYKGLIELFEAFAGLPDEGRPRRLVIAGKPDRDGETIEVLRRARSDPRVTVHARRIPDSDIQLFLRAADVVVLPYHDALNSGVLLLALTFGVPVVAPDVPGIREVLDPDYARTFTPFAPDSLRVALRGAEALCAPEARAAALRSTEARHPAMISERFVRELLGHLER